MGYTYSGSGFRTKIDLSRQIYQNCDTYATFSGSTTFGDNIAASYLSGNTWNFSVTASTGTTAIVAINQQPTITGSSLQINSDTLLNRAGDYDLELDGNGEVTIQTSSRRYKTNITDLDIPFKQFLNIKPKKFIRGGKEEVGLIAEEMHDEGLYDFVIYKDGLVEGIKYKRLSLILLELIKDLYQDRKPLYMELDDDQTIKTITTDYSTKDNKYIVTKNNDICITLDHTKTKRVYIKSMTNTMIKTKDGVLIDDEFESIDMGPQSSVELIFGDGWFVLSSDGLKNS